MYMYVYVDIIDKDDTEVSNWGHCNVCRRL